MPTQDPLSDHDLTVLREIRRHAMEIADNASLLFWETSYPATIRRRLHDSLKALADLSPYAVESFAPTTRTRYSWDGQTTTAHVESV